MAPTGLRERKQAAAMRRIQECALELMDRDGFHAVTIEQIAHAAEVSPSSVYRYFGTKEGVVLKDEYDATFAASMDQLLREQDLPEALASALSQIGPEHLQTDSDRTRSRMRWAAEVPSVKAAALLEADRMAWMIGEALHQVRPQGRTAAQCHASAHGIVFAFLAALEVWYSEESDQPVRDYVLNALQGL